MSRKTEQIAFRTTPEMYDLLKKKAAAAHRSVGGQITHMLSFSLAFMSEEFSAPSPGTVSFALPEIRGEAAREIYASQVAPFITLTRTEPEGGA